MNEHVRLKFAEKILHTIKHARLRAPQHCDAWPYAVWAKLSSGLEGHRHVEPHLYELL